MLQWCNGIKGYIYSKMHYKMAKDHGYAPEGGQTTLLYHGHDCTEFHLQYSQHCQRSLIPGAETSSLRAKCNPGLVYFDSFV